MGQIPVDALKEKASMAVHQPLKKEENSIEGYAIHWNPLAQKQ